PGRTAYADLDGMSNRQFSDALESLLRPTRSREESRLLDQAEDRVLLLDRNEVDAADAGSASNLLHELLRDTEALLRLGLLGGRFEACDDLLRDVDPGHLVPEVARGARRARDEDRCEDEHPV